MGADYSLIGVTSSGNAMSAFRSTAMDADKGMYGDLSRAESISTNPTEPFYLRVKVTKGAVCTFSYSSDGKQFTTIGEPFKARAGRWIGAKIGFFFTRSGKFNDAGSADIDWIRFEK
jgi:beta-xylosidase